MKVFRVDDRETGNMCIYEGIYLQNAFETIRYAAKAENEYAEEFEDYEQWDLTCDGERIWCGKTDTVAELCDVCFEEPILEKSVEDYIDAMWHWGSDPICLENMEQAVNVFLHMNEDGVTATRLSGEDLETAWKHLDLEEEKPSVVYSCGKYNQERWEICFKEDY